MTDRELAERLADGEIGPGGITGQCPACCTSRLRISRNGTSHREVVCEGQGCPPGTVAQALGITANDLLRVPQVQPVASSHGSFLARDKEPRVDVVPAEIAPKDGDAFTVVQAASLDPKRYSTWDILDLAAKVPIDHRALAYNIVLERVAQVAQAPEREMLIRQAAKVFPGVPRERFRRDVARFAEASSEPLPWHEPVDGSALLDEIVKEFQRYLVLPPYASEALALWSVYTHVIDAFDVAPIMALISPVKRCGKTKAIEVATQIVRRPLAASNITPAALFRAVDKFQPTLLIDEGDTFLRDKDDLRGILNSGHTRGTAYVIRTVGDEHEPRSFSTWGPRLIALIGRLPDTLEDRAIVVPMQRRAANESVAKLRRARLAEFVPLRRKAARWAVDNLGDLSLLDPSVPDELDDRAADNWSPLLAIAESAGGEWPQKAREAALALSGAGARTDDAIGIRLLADLRGFLVGSEREKAYTTTLLGWLESDPESPWPTWNRGKPISPKQIATLLRPFGIRSKQLRHEGTTGKGYERADFEDAFRRYLPHHPKHAKHVSSDNGLPDISEPKRDTVVSRGERAANPRTDSDVSNVSDRSPETPHMAETGVADLAGKAGKKQPVRKLEPRKQPLT